ncbi:MAG: ABC transporter substrate-binding protein [Candidatus Methylomirabilales bacterium]
MLFYYGIDGSLAVGAPWWRFLGILLQATGLAMAPSVWRRRAMAAEELAVGALVGPGEAGQYAVAATELAAEEANYIAGAFGKVVRLLAEVAISPEDAAKKATKLVRQRGAKAILGGGGDPLTQAIEEASAREGVIYLNSMSRSEVLRGPRCRRLTFHVEASLAMYTDTIAQWLVRRAKQPRWGFLTPDSETGAEMERLAKRALRRHGGTPVAREVVPASTRDYRAALAALAKAGPDVLIINLAGLSLLQALAQFTELGLAVQVSGPVMEAVEFWQAEPAKLTGIWPALWSHGFRRYSGRELNKRLAEALGKPAESHAWASYTAMKAVWEAVFRGGQTDTAGLVSFFEKGHGVDAHKGQLLTFRPWDHQLRQPLMVLRCKVPAADATRWDVFELLGEVPLRGTPGESRAAILDTLGLSKAESGCRLGPVMTE